MDPLLTALREHFAEVQAIAEQADRSYAFFDEEDYTAAAVVVEDEDNGRVLMRVLGPIYSGFNFNRQRTERALDRVGNLSSIHLVVDSPGGFLDAGVSIYNILNSRRKKGVKLTAMVEGLAASAAVMPLLAAGDRQIEPGSKMMIHRPWTGMFAYVLGHADDLLEGKRKIGENIDEAVSSLNAGEGQLRELLELRTGMNKKAVKDSLAGGNSWYNTQEALDAGLVTAIAADGDEDDSTEQDEAHAEARHRLAQAYIRNVLTEEAQ